VKPGYYWATDCIGQRVIVSVEIWCEGAPNQVLCVWAEGEGVKYAYEDFTNYVPVACEESAAALEAFDKHEWPYNLSEDDAKLIETAIAKNREARS